MSRASHLVATFAITGIFDPHEFDRLIAWEGNHLTVDSGPEVTWFLEWDEYNYCIEEVISDLLDYVGMEPHELDRVGAFINQNNATATLKLNVEVFELAPLFELSRDGLERLTRIGAGFELDIKISRDPNVHCYDP